MTWIKLEDKTPRHPKVAGLSDKAFRVWINSLCYASEFLTDGVLPLAFMNTIKPSVITELIQAGLWEKDSHGTVCIHDYLGHQTPKSKIEAKRDQARERARKLSGNFPENTQKAVEPEYRSRSTEVDQKEQEQERRPLIRGEATPIGYGKIHGAHVIGFCDWCCLPEFVFDEFRRKSGEPSKLPDEGEAYVRGWALKVRESWRGPIGDNLKFWRTRWNESHPDAPQQQDPLEVALASLKRQQAETAEWKARTGR